MALLSGYVDAAAYRARTQDKATGTDTVLDAQLVAASRTLEKKLGLAPGYFNSATGTRRFSGRGTPLLWLVDGMGAHCLQSVDTDGITVDTDADGTANYTFDPAGESWVVGEPRNAAVFSEPYTRLRLLDLTSNTSLRVWARGEYNVAIAATWGWSAVPGEIAELTAQFVHEVRSGHLAGPTLDLQALDSAISLGRGDIWRRWKTIERQYGMRTGVRVVTREAVPG